ncbi:hypothetical protein NPX89_31440, partial [Bacillus mycoides]|nr:hypothetical protein [Bacillus mycoides]
AYPDWLIEKKITNSEQTFLGVKVELTSEVEMFEMRRGKKWQSCDRFLAGKGSVVLVKTCYICIVRSGGKHNSLCFS